MTRWLSFGVALFCVALLGCTRREPKVQPTLSISFSGCSSVRRGRVCELDGPRTLTLWAETPTLEVTIDGRPQTPRSVKHLQGGTRVSLEVAKGAALLIAQGQGKRGTLTFAAASYPEALARAKRARASGDLAAAQRAVDAHMRDAGADPCALAQGTALSARLAYSRGEIDATISRYRASIPALLRCGLLSEAAADAFALSYVLNEHKPAFDEAARVLEDLATRLDDDDESRAWAHHYRALSAFRLGELGRSLSELAAGERAAERLGLDALASALLQMKGWLHGVLGRHDLASEVLSRALPSATSLGPCERAAALCTAGYQRLLAAEAGQSTVEAARALLGRAEQIAHACNEQPILPRILMNLAEASVMAGDLERATQELERARGLASEGDIFWHTTWLDVRGRALLKGGDARRALAVYDELVARTQAATASLPRGQLGRARALLALGRRQEADRALHEAERELDAQLMGVPLSTGLESFVVGRRDVSMLRVETLLSLGQTDAALEAIERAHGRVIDTLASLATDEREDHPRARAAHALAELRAVMERDQKRAFLLPTDELAALTRAQRERSERLQELLDEAFPARPRRTETRILPRDGLLIALFPLEHDVAVIVRDAHGSLAQKVPSHAVAAVLTSHIERIRSARLLTVLAPSEGSLSAPHALDVAGAPLIAHAPVVYATSVPPARHERQARRGALFVIDPRGDLPFAAREGALLEQQRAGRAERRFVRGREATRGALLKAFLEIDAFHFAGHAVVSRDAFWESGLELALSTRLTVADVLSAPRVPARIVLSACNTATPARAGYAVGIGLAQALLVRGAREVVATTDPVSDRAALTFAEIFYGSADAPLAERVQRAVLTLRARGLDWQAYRVLVP